MTGLDNIMCKSRERVPVGWMTVGEVASWFGVTVSQVQYVLKARQIACKKRVHHLRLYNRTAILRIGRALREIAEKKEAGLPRTRKLVDRGGKRRQESCTR